MSETDEQMLAEEIRDMLEKGIVERVKNFKCVFFYIECLEDHPVLLDKVLSQVEEDGPKARRHK